MLLTCRSHTGLCMNGLKEVIMWKSISLDWRKSEYFFIDDILTQKMCFFFPFHHSGNKNPLFRINDSFYVIQKWHLHIICILCCDWSTVTIMRRLWIRILKIPLPFLARSPKRAKLAILSRKDRWHTVSLLSITVTWANHRLMYVEVDG